MGIIRTLRCRSCRVISKQLFSHLETIYSYQYIFAPPVAHQLASLIQTPIELLAASHHLLLPYSQTHRTYLPPNSLRTLPNHHPDTTHDVILSITPQYRQPRPLPLPRKRRRLLAPRRRMVRQDPLHAAPDPAHHHPARRAPPRRRAALAGALRHRRV